MRTLAILVIAGCGSRDPAWQPIDYKDCELAAAVPAELVPPLRWQPCRIGGACRELAVDWDPDPALPEWIAPDTFMTRTGGNLAMHTARFTRDGTIRLIAEVDGPVRVAVREGGRDRCTTNLARSAGGVYAIRVFDSEATGKLDAYGGGAVGGALDEPPRMLLAMRDRVVRSFAAGTPGLVENTGDTLRLHAWTGGAPREIWREPGLVQSHAVFEGDALLWSASGAGVARQMVWTDRAGARTLIGFPDRTRGAADLGSDGRDLVWLEGSGRTGTGRYPKVAIMTAPFTVEPAALQPRVVVDNVSSYGFGTQPFVVGCGHAARSAGGGTLVVRLADGATAQLPDSAGADWGWRTPLALTCDELFVLVHAGHATVARVPLATLIP
jgi:hypothetical protein